MLFDLKLAIPLHATRMSAILVQTRIMLGYLPNLKKGNRFCINSNPGRLLPNEKTIDKTIKKSKPMFYSDLSQ
jgi:hypothetical protein